ncbi:MAG: sulfatase-like hydrolase/transferase [Planctomycetota bacterium]
MTRWVALAILAGLLGTAYLVWRLTRGSNELGVSSVVLITLDGVRPDALCPRGKAPPLAPCLDRLAAEGIRFERCLTTSPNTVPAHASIFSGTDPVAHGCRVDGAFAFAPFNPSLAVVLREHGFLTGAFVSSEDLDRSSGLDLGFDLYNFQSLAEDGTPDPTVGERPGEFTVRSALEFVTGAGSAPFLLWVHLSTGDTPASLQERFAARRKDAWKESLSRVDGNVQALLVGLRERRRLEDALIMVSGGHGEGLGEHGEWGHSLLLYDGTLRVPLIVWSRGRLEPGGVVSGAISVASVAPTLLDLLELERPPGMYGRSRVLDLAAGRGDGAGEESDLVCFETLAPERRYGFASLQGVELDGYKLILGPDPELYRPDRDPQEAEDLMTRERDVADRLRRRLESHLAEHGRPPSESGPKTLPVPSVAALKEVAGRLPEARTAAIRTQNPRAGLGVVAALEEARDLALTDRAAALALLEDLLQAEPQVVSAELLRGRLLEEQGDLDGALSALAAALALAPADPVVYARLGQVLTKLERHDAAETCLLGALEVDPTFQEARVGLGLLYLKTERYSLARIRFDQVLSRFPGLVDACMGRAICLLEMGNVRLADEDLRTAIGSDPDNPEVLALLVRTSLLLANEEQALFFYRQAQAQGINFPWPAGFEQQ